jgi:hypothetical protein
MLGLYLLACPQSTTLDVATIQMSLAEVLDGLVGGLSGENFIQIGSTGLSVYFVDYLDFNEVLRMIYVMNIVTMKRLS